MVKLFQKIVKAYKSYVLYRRCKRAIKRADRQAVTTGKKQLVIMYGGKPLVVSKQHLKQKIKEGAFCKGFTPEKAESLAIYKTH
jgi:hypothetical protein